MSDQRTHIEIRHGTQTQGDDMAVLSDEQFAELKALLQPGFELSTIMLARYKEEMAARDADLAARQEPPHAAEPAAPESPAAADAPVVDPAAPAVPS